MKTAETEHGHQLPTLPADRAAELAPRLYWQAGRSVDFDAPTAKSSEAVQVYVNHDRWIVECPDCRGAQLASRTDRRFMCHCCGNAAIGGKWRPVVWPAAGLLAGIEKALAGRMMETNRNWRPGETAADLQAENDAMIQEVR